MSALPTQARCADVEREGYARPDPITFESVALGWLDTYPVVKSLKTSTVEGYTCIVKTHLVAWFGGRDMNSVTTADVQRYVAAKQRGG